VPARYAGSIDSAAPRLLAKLTSIRMWAHAAPGSYMIGIV